MFKVAFDLRSTRLTNFLILRNRQTLGGVIDRKNVTHTQLNKCIGKSTAAVLLWEKWTTIEILLSLRQPIVLLLVYNYIVLALWFSSVAKITAYRPQVADFKDICASFLFKLRIHIRTQTSSSIPFINQLYTQ